MKVEVLQTLKSDQHKMANYTNDYQNAAEEDFDERENRWLEDTNRWVRRTYNNPVSHMQQQFAVSGQSFGSDSNARIGSAAP